MSKHLKTVCMITSEAAIKGVVQKKKFVEILHNSQENTYGRVSLFKKFQSDAWNIFKKETLAQVLSMNLEKVLRTSF